MTDREFELTMLLREHNTFTATVAGAAKRLADLQPGPAMETDLRTIGDAMVECPELGAAVRAHVAHEVAFAERGRPDHVAAGRAVRAWFDAADVQVLREALRVYERNPVSDQFVTECLRRVRETVVGALSAWTGRAVWREFPDLAGRSTWAAYKPTSTTGATT